MNRSFRGRVVRMRLVSALAGLAVMGAATAIAYSNHSSHNAQDRVDAYALASEIALRLEGILNNRLALTGGIAAYALSHSPDIDDEEFQTFARDLGATFERYRGFEWEDPSLRSLQIAPDGVVTHVWPIEGNEAAIGHDIINDPARGEAVRRAIDTKAFVLAGPFELKQGGLGIIGRSPIFTQTASGTDKFWGFATVVLDFNEILLLADLPTSKINGYELAIRGRDGLGAEGELFFGEEHVVGHDPVLLTVTLPQGEWELAIHPSEHWHVFGTRGATQSTLIVGLLLAISVASGLTRWQRAHLLATESSDDLSLLLSSAGGPIIATDSCLSVTHWNAATTRLTGITNYSAVGRSLTDLTTVFSPLDGEKSLADVAESASDNATSKTLSTYVDGAPGRFVDFGIAMRGSGGVVCVGLDTTERHETERISADLAALEQTSLFKDQFLASTSHELRTPLTSILGLAELLADGSFGEMTSQQRSTAEQIASSGEHLLSIINQLLDLSSLAAGRLDLDREIVDVNRLAHEAIAIIEPIASARSVTIRQQLASFPVTVDADRVRLRQVMLNLLSNAVKFTLGDGEVGIETSYDAGQAVVTVWDTGVGIPAGKQHLLFQPFVRIENSSGSGGTGLGLVITSELVELHGGEISVESQEGLGSRFTVRMPAAHLAAVD